MGFLHLVFLGFITLFILAFITHAEILDINKPITKAALLTFTTGIVFNLALLWTQGLGALLIKSSPLFPWFLWIAAIWLFVGGTLLVIARRKSRVSVVAN
jgi:hypothetical protein